MPTWAESTNDKTKNRPNKVGRYYWDVGFPGLVLGRVFISNPIPKTNLQTLQKNTPQPDLQNFGLERWGTQKTVSLLPGGGVNLETIGTKIPTPRKMNG